MRFGGVEVLVETVPVTGTEPTARWGDAEERVLGALDSAQHAIVGLAATASHVMDQLSAHPTAHPAKLEVEFGVGFTAKGNVIFASGEANATLKVKLTYDAPTGT